MPTSMIWLLVAVAAGWFFQLQLTFKQSVAFNKQVIGLRQQGTVTVGVAGRRYRGGRAFVAMALNPATGEDRVVRGAISLSGWTTFARGKQLPGLVGVKASVIEGDRDIPGLTRQQRDAAREALRLLDQERRVPASQTPAEASPARDS